MRAWRFAAVFLTASMMFWPAFAATRTETLRVAHMTCDSCPYIVRQALFAVHGVTAAAVSYATKTATVTFDDTRTDVSALTRAMAEAGYPSELLK